MLRGPPDAFTRGEAAAGRRVIEQDDEVDRMYERVFHDLIDMTAEAAVIKHSY